jgi:predicted TIM-barrel fold metal-dependent hydrolase
MDASTLPKISADSHINEPHDLWYSRLPSHLRDDAPHRIQEEGDGGWRLVVNGEVDISGSVGMSAERTEDLEGHRATEDLERERDASPEPRLEMMRTDGLNGEIIFPTIGLYVFGVGRPEVGIESCRIYNDWIRERMGEDSPRIRYAALIPTWDAQSAVEEVNRVASWRNVGGLMIPMVGSPDWNMPEWEPLWSTAAETGLPMVMHQGSGHSMIFYRGWGSPVANLLATQSMAPRAAGLLACGGVLARHPDLHFVMVEVNAGWMAWTMNTLDDYHQAFGAASRKPNLEELPSHYLRHQVHATFQTDPVAIATRELTGLDCLMWGNDYPHAEGTFPHSNAVLDDLLAGVDEASAVQITAGNAARIFGFDQSVLVAGPE